MPDYIKSYIYKICCTDASIEEIYVGSTCNFSRRKRDHKSRCHNEACEQYKSYVYQFVRDHGGWANWDMIMIEEFSCDTKMQKERKERGWIETLKPTLNKAIPAHYQTGDVSNRLEYDKTDYNQNKDKIQTQHKNTMN